MEEKIFDEIWQNGIIVLDTCTLDFIERCDVLMAKRIMDVFLMCKEHVFIPNHVKDIEMKNNIDLQKKKTSMKDKINLFKKDLADILSSSGLLEKEKRVKIKSKIQKFINQLEKYDFQILSSKLKEVHNYNQHNHQGLINFLQSDECSNTIMEYDEFLDSNTVKEFYSLIMYNVLETFTESQIHNIEKEGEIRRVGNIPPACGDGYKTENSFGDLIIWKEILQDINKRSNFKKYAFVTEDLKRGSNWFSEDKKTIHPMLREEVIRNCGYDAVCISSLSDFITSSNAYVNGSIDDLVKYIKRKNIRVVDVVEEYLKNEGYDLLTEKTLEAISKHCDVDYSILDPFLDIRIEEFFYDIKENVEVELKLQVEFDTESCVRFGGDDWTDDSQVSAILFAIVSINILEGYYTDDIYSLDLKNMSLEIVECDVDATAPFGMDEHDEEQYEYDYEVDNGYDEEQYYCDDESEF